MRLALSSAAAPDASFEELLAACVRRGLAGLELRDVDGHGVDVDQSSLDRAAGVARAAAADVVITGYRVSGIGDAERLAWLAASLNAPVLLDCAAGPLRQRIEDALRLRDAGVGAAVVVRGVTAVRDAADVAAAELSIAWDADAAQAPIADYAEALLRDCGAALRHITLIGGGPEVAMQEGMGVGALMGRLALGGFDGNLALAPSSPRYRIAWQTWLGRRGGWGCGSKAEAAALPLTSNHSAAGAGR